MSFYINKKRFISTVKFHFDSVKDFCKLAGMSRNNFYKILSKPYKTKYPPAFSRLFNLLNYSIEDGKYSYEIFWKKL